MQWRREPNYLAMAVFVSRYMVLQSATQYFPWSTGLDFTGKSLRF